MAIFNQKTSTVFTVAEERGQGASQGGADIQGWSLGVQLRRSEGVWGPALAAGGARLYQVASLKL